jgi:hypothetical protein
VHFDDLDNRTQHFFQANKSMAVVADSPLVYPLHGEAASFSEVGGTTTQAIRLINFMYDSTWHEQKQVHVEHFFLSSDGSTLIGAVAVKNLSFHKLVAARFTLDDWRTTSETVAVHIKDPEVLSSDSCDMFNFNLDLSDVANIGKKVLQLCVRYNVNGRDYWDNYNGMNYHIEFATIGEDFATSRSQLYVSTTPPCPLAWRM